MKYKVSEVTAMSGARPCGGRAFNDKLAAMLAAFMWKMNTGKDAAVYDALGNPVYLTSNETEPQEIKDAISDGFVSGNSVLSGIGV